MRQFSSSLIILFLSLFLLGCNKPTNENTSEPKLTFKVKFDETLPRLGNFGESVSVPTGNAAQSPKMRSVSLHYIELAPDSLTLLGNGQVLYQGEETNQGGATAIDFSQAVIKENNQAFTTVNLSKLTPGTYNWIRVSLSYQNYDINFRLNAPPYIINQDFEARLASFVGFNNYIGSYYVKDSLIELNTNKLQGYWAFETGVNYAGISYGSLTEGDGARVTVINPISSTSPVPVGSCVVTGKLTEPLIVTGNETSNIEIVLAFSINNSFEWVDTNPDGYFEPAAGETVVDMGLRGLHPYVVK